MCGPGKRHSPPPAAFGPVFPAPSLLKPRFSRAADGSRPPLALPRQLQKEARKADAPRAARPQHRRDLRQLERSAHAQRAVVAEPQQRRLHRAGGAGHSGARRIRLPREGEPLSTRPPGSPGPSAFPAPPPPAPPRAALSGIAPPPPSLLRPAPPRPGPAPRPPRPRLAPPHPGLAPPLPARPSRSVWGPPRPASVLRGSTALPSPSSVPPSPIPPPRPDPSPDPPRGPLPGRQVSLALCVPRPLLIHFAVFHRLALF